MCFTYSKEARQFGGREMQEMQGMQGMDGVVPERVAMRAPQVWVMVPTLCC